MTHPSTRPYVWMLSGTFVFTFMVELAYDLTQVSKVCDWQTVAFARSFLAAVFAAILAWAAGAKLVFWRPGRLWVRSVAGSCSMVCTFYSFGQLPAVDVVTLTNTFPIWVAVFSWPLYGQPPGRNVWVAVFVGVIGVGMVEQPHLESGNLGVLAALAAAMFSAVAMLGLHSLQELDPRAIVVHFSGVASVFCVGAFFLFPRHADPASTLNVVALQKLGGVGLAATVGQLCLTLAFATGAPAKVSVVGLTQIVFALVFDVCVWGREVNAVTILGTLLVITPTAWLLTRPTAPHSLDADEEPDDPPPAAPDPAETPAR